VWNSRELGKLEEVKEACGGWRRKRRGRGECLERVGGMLSVLSWDCVSRVIRNIYILKALWPPCGMYFEIRGVRQGFLW
jgi:hypothetical protein